MMKYGTRRRTSTSICGYCGIDFATFRPTIPCAGFESGYYNWVDVWKLDISTRSLRLGRSEFSEYVITVPLSTTEFLFIYFLEIGWVLVKLQKWTRRTKNQLILRKRRQKYFQGQPSLIYIYIHNYYIEKKSSSQIFVARDLRPTWSVHRDSDKLEFVKNSSPRWPKITNVLAKVCPLRPQKWT